MKKGKTGESSPAVVVSATETVKETGCAQVAWLTNKEENSSPTHVKVMCVTPSVAICEKLSFAYLDRFGEFVRTCTEKEIQDIDNAMLATQDMYGPKEYCEACKDKIEKCIKQCVNHGKENYEP